MQELLLQLVDTIVAMMADLCHRNLCYSITELFIVWQVGIFFAAATGIKIRICCQAAVENSENKKE